MRKIFGRLPTRGLPDRREAWDDYLDFVRRQVSTEALIAAHATELEALAEGGRGGGALPWRDDKDQVTGLRFADKTVLLTFDDGPSARLTPKVLEILARFGVHGVFFEVGRNVGKAEEQPRRILASGDAVANHSFTHAFLPKLDAAHLGHELVDTNQAIEAAAKQKTVLFRPPLRRAQRSGAAGCLRDGNEDRALERRLDGLGRSGSALHRRSRGEQVERKKRGIILFHDIHEQSIEALPLVIAELQKRGYTFLSWDGHDFTAPRGGPGGAVDLAAAAPVAEGPTPSALGGLRLYRESWAVVIGINAYKSWPHLSYAVNDAQGVREILVRKYGFLPDHVTTLLDGEATREKILAALGDDARRRAQGHARRSGVRLLRRPRRHPQAPERQEPGLHRPRRRRRPELPEHGHLHDQPAGRQRRHPGQARPLRDGRLLQRPGADPGRRRRRGRAIGAST